MPPWRRSGWVRSEAWSVPGPIRRAGCRPVSGRRCAAEGVIIPDNQASRTLHLEADVLVIGAGAAGMYAAIEAARRGAGRVLLLDRSLIGRGGATVMAQMTVAAAVGPEG